MIPREVAVHIQEEVYQQLHLKCSIGIAPSSNVVELPIDFS